jgi:arabinofuranosyltransferase
MSPTVTRTLRWLALALVGVQVVRFGWLSDDAWITFRTADNLVHGYGLTWNVTERVQAFTNPLFLFLMTGVYALTREVVLSVILLGAALSLAAATLVGWRLARSAAAGAFALAILACSRTFIDYSTSGLENPLAHLLLAVFLVCWLARSGPLLLAGVTALMMVNRMDSVLLVAPALAWELGRSWRRWLAAAAGLAPLWGWMLFALVYYGSPFPNTAYAKLNNGIAAGELIRQGLDYVRVSAIYDPVAALALVAGLVLGARRDARTLPLVVGIVVHAAYVVKIGGDFMAGRFLSAPLVVAVVLIGRAELPWRHARLAALVLVAALGLAGARAPLRPGATHPAIQNRLRDCVIAAKIADERACWYQTASLASPAPLAAQPTGFWRDIGNALRTEAARTHRRVVSARSNIGVVGFYAGPDVHIIDPYALADPLLARLPAVDDGSWGIGHFTRVLPEGYEQAVVEGADRLADPALADLYRDVVLVTRGPIWSRARWAAIGRLLRGGDRFDVERYRHPKR